MKDKFEQWFLSIPDVDETLIDKDENGRYKDLDMDIAYASFMAGYNLGTHR